MTATGQDASAIQVNTMRSPMIKKTIDFSRFQILLDLTAKKTPNKKELDKKIWQQLVARFGRKDFR
jgi:uncharacterized protein